MQANVPCARCRVLLLGRVLSSNKVHLFTPVQPLLIDPIVASGTTTVSVIEAFDACMCALDACMSSIHWSSELPKGYIRCVSSEQAKPTVNVCTYIMLFWNEIDVSPLFKWCVFDFYRKHKNRDMPDKSLYVLEFCSSCIKYGFWSVLLVDRCDDKVTTVFFLTANITTSSCCLLSGGHASSSKQPCQSHQFSTFSAYPTHRKSPNRLLTCSWLVSRKGIAAAVSMYSKSTRRV